MDGLLGGCQRQGVTRVGGGRRDEAGGSRLHPERVGSGQADGRGAVERHRPARYREGRARRGQEIYLVQRKRSLALGMDGGGDGDAAG